VTRSLKFFATRCARERRDATSSCVCVCAPVGRFNGRLEVDSLETRVWTTAAAAAAPPRPTDSQVPSFTLPLAPSCLPPSPTFQSSALPFAFGFLYVEIIESKRDFTFNAAIVLIAQRVHASAWTFRVKTRRNVSRQEIREAQINHARFS